MPLNHTSQYAELTDEQFGIIGRLVIEWSNIDFLLGVLLSRLLFTPEFLGRVYSDEMNASRIQSAVQKAIDIHKNRYGFRVVPEETIDEITKVNSEIDKVRRLRNTFAHFCWCRSNDEEIFGSGLSGFIPPSKRLDKDSVKFSVVELQDAYTMTYEIVERLTGIIHILPEVDEKKHLL
ncbi:MAG: hypothetical protein ACYC7E_05470 [Armatimonadota bacterium]